MFFGRDLFDDQEHWFIESVRGACANDRVNWIVKLHPANVWKRQARPRQRRARRARRDPRAHRRAPAAREAAGTRHRHLDVVAVRRHRLRPDDPRLDRLRAAVLRQAGAHRRHRLLLRPRLHRRLRDRARSTSAGSRGSTSSTPPSAEDVELAKKHAYALFTLRQTRFTSFRSVFKPLEEIDDPYEATIEMNLRERGRARAGGGPTPARRVGRPLPRARLPRAVGRSCRSAAARAASRPASRGEGRS